MVIPERAYDCLPAPTDFDAPVVVAGFPAVMPDLTLPLTLPSPFTYICYYPPPPPPRALPHADVYLYDSVVHGPFTDTQYVVTLPLDIYYLIC